MRLSINAISVVAASYENKIYTVGGELVVDVDGTSTRISGIYAQHPRYFHNSFAELGYPDSYLRILDFSKPVDPSIDSIDISTNNITTATRLPDNIPRLEHGTLLISDGVMHMLPGTHSYWEIADEYGNVLNTTTYRTDLTNNVWDFDLQSQNWDVQVSGVEHRAQDAAVAFDAENQVGWYYGGFVAPDHYLNATNIGPELERMSPDLEPVSATMLQDLYRLDRGQGAPVKVETNSTLVGNVVQGELVYIGGAGEAGILVLIGGGVDTSSTQRVSMVD